MGAKLFGPEMRVLKFEYDFAVVGGAVGVISLGKLPEGFAVMECKANVETELTGAGTLVAGVLADSDKFFTDMQALSVGLVDESGALSSASYKVIADDEMVVEIASATVTAGKVQFYVIGFQA